MIKLIFCGLLALATALPVAGVTLAIDSVTGMPGSLVRVPVRAADFQQIISMQGTVEWDTAQVSYVAVDSFGLIGLNASSFGMTLVSAGKLTFSWNDNALQGVDLPDSAVVFSLTLLQKCGVGCCSGIDWANDPTAPEFADTSFGAIAFQLVPGAACVEDTTIPTGWASLQGIGQLKAFPNPVITSAMIETGNQPAQLLTLHGQVVAYFPANQRMLWSGTDARGALLPRGIYLLTNGIETRKIYLNQRP